MEHGVHNLPDPEAKILNKMRIMAEESKDDFVEHFDPGDPIQAIMLKKIQNLVRPTMKRKMREDALARGESVPHKDQRQVEEDSLKFIKDNPERVKSVLKSPAFYTREELDALIAKEDQPGLLICCPP